MMHKILSITIYEIVTYTSGKHYSLTKATGKKLNDYHRLKSTQEYFDAYSLKTGIPVIKIIEVKTGCYGGTWIHPKASIHLAIWCSPEFAVMVSEWVFELLTKGSVSIKPEPTQTMAECAKINSDLLESFGITGEAKRTALNNTLKDRFRYNALQEWNVKTEVIEAEVQSLNPTLIAKRTRLRNSRQANLKLTELKLQTPYRDNNKHLHYKLTKLGMKHATYQEKSYNSSRPIRSIQWHESVLVLF
ncbi:MAG: KilA-N domain-containing protein [Candidatus Marithrix sp.]